MIDLLKQKLADAELVLVGIGEEWEIKPSDYSSIPEYKELADRLGENSGLLPFIQAAVLKKSDFEKAVIRKREYELLAEFLDGKNYFVVSLCTDGLLQEAGFRPDRIVTPCGDLRKLQCSGKCNPKITSVTAAFMEQTDALLQGSIEPEQLSIPECEACGEPLIPNTIAAENYAEEGYLEQWSVYTKWLQGTVNRRVCILELGVGMRFPTVIRWPFEKVAFFNQKASFFRIHTKLYQTTEEIKERSYGIKASPEEFMKELFHEFQMK